MSICVGSGRLQHLISEQRQHLGSPHDSCGADIHVLLKQPVSRPLHTDVTSVTLINWVQTAQGTTAKSFLDTQSISKTTVLSARARGGGEVGGGSE